MRNQCSVVIAAVFTACLVFGLGGVAPAAENLDETIKYLMDYVEKSDSTVIRNGKAQTGKVAAQDMKERYDHFKKDIKTPEDFIRLCATKSYTTGKPLLVKAKDGKEAPLSDWLTNVLKEHRKSSKESKSAPPANP